MIIQPHPLLVSSNHLPIRSQWRSETHLWPIKMHGSPHRNAHRPVKRSDRKYTTPVCLISCHTTVLLRDQTAAVSMRRCQHPDTQSCMRTASSAGEERAAAGSSDLLLHPETCLSRNREEISQSPSAPPQSLCSEYLKKVREHRPQTLTPDSSCL